MTKDFQVFQSEIDYGGQDPHFVGRLNPCEFDGWQQAAEEYIVLIKYWAIQDKIRGAQGTLILRWAK